MVKPDSPEPRGPTEALPTRDPLAAWEAQLEEAAFSEAGGRRNSFDTARKKTFLKALAKGATLKEAAKAACVTPQTLYNHQRSDERFAAECRAAAQVLAPVNELAAFERAVVGGEEIQRMCDQSGAEHVAKGYYKHAETELMVPPGWAVVRIETLHDPGQIDQSCKAAGLAAAVPFGRPTR